MLARSCITTTSIKNTDLYDILFEKILSQTLKSLKWMCRWNW